LNKKIYKRISEKNHFPHMRDAFSCPTGYHDCREAFNVLGDTPITSSGFQPLNHNQENNNTQTKPQSDSSAQTVCHREL
jgi:hypothetical protein